MTNFSLLAAEIVKHFYNEMTDEDKKTFILDLEKETLINLKK